MTRHYIGYVGMFLLQAQNVPIFIKAFTSGMVAGIPASVPVIVIVGLACYLHHSLMIGRVALLYTISNSVGIFSNVVLLWLILW